MKLLSCKSIRNWISSLNGEPGFLKEVFTALNCDYGNEIDIEGIDTLVSEVLVFMLVTINRRWKLPVDYFLQNKSTAVAQAILIKSALIHVYDNGLNVCSVTCDGAYILIFLP